MMDDRISMLEDRITALEKLLKLVTLPDKNAILSELLNDAPRIYSFDFTSEKSDFSQWRLINADEITEKENLSIKLCLFQSLIERFTTRCLQMKRCVWKPKRQNTFK